MATTIEFRDAPYQVLDKEFSGASDRAAAIVAASFVDEQLTTLIRAAMVEDDNKHADLFAPSQPLGSFMAKVRLAFALGLVDESEKRRLSLIAKIRNEFAHATADLSFSTSRIADRCRELAFPIHLVVPRIVPDEIDLEELSDFRTPLADRENPRALFEEATLCLLYMLKGRHAQAGHRRPTIPKPFSNAAEPAGEFLALAMVQKRIAIDAGRPKEEIADLQRLVLTLRSVVVHAAVGSSSAGRPVDPRPLLEWQAQARKSLAEGPDEPSANAGVAG